MLQIVSRSSTCVCLYVYYLHLPFEQGVHFGCSKGKLASGIRGISVDRNKGQLPKVITQTWAERSRNEKNEVSSGRTWTVDRDFGKCYYVFLPYFVL